MGEHSMCTAPITGVWCNQGCANRSACRKHCRYALSPLSKHRLESYRAIVKSAGAEPSHGELAELWGIHKGNVIRLRNQWERMGLIPVRQTRPTPTQEHP